MYVMLIDDETIILNGLARFLTRKWPEMEISRFDNASDALDAIAKRIPDLMITDIYMPEMNGIELIEQAVKLGVKHYAILTGYDEFTLVQRALRLQTMDYLLKPVDKEQLYAMVEQAMRLTEQADEAADKSLRSSLRLMCQFGVKQSDLIVPLSASEVFSGSSHCALALFESGLTDSNAAELLRPLSALAQSVIALGEDVSHHQMLLFAIAAGNLSAFEEAARRLEQKPHLMSIATAAAELSQLHGLYRQALEKQMSGLSQAVNAFLSGTDAAAALDSVFAAIGAFNDRLEMLGRFLSAVNRQQNLWVLAALMSDYPQQEESIRRTALSAWLNALGNAPQPTSREIVAAVDMIEQHFAEELNLLDVSSQVFMTPSYFSTLFHREVGQTYVEYINQVRINHACAEILRNGASIESIAAQVGFANTHYFFKVFKRYTGMTPGAFRGLAK